MHSLLKQSLLMGIIALMPLSCKMGGDSSELQSATNLGGKVVKIKNYETKKCLENWDYGGWNGKKILQNGCKSNNTQKWQLHFKDVESGLYVIRPQAGSDTVIDITHDGNSDGVQLWKYNDGNRNQLWAIVESGIGKYTIRSAALPKKCLGFSKGNTKDSTQLEILDCIASKSQLWLIEK